MSKGTAYLATPLTHPDISVIMSRTELVNKIFIYLIRQGISVYSPITQTGVLAVQYGLPMDFNAYEHLDRDMLARMDKLMVIKADGWKESKGVAAEIKHAKELGMPIEYIDPEEIRHLLPERISGY